MSSPFSIISLLELESNPEVASERLGNNFSESWFCGVRDHGIDESLVKEVMKLFVKFFELPLDNKLNYSKSNTGGARGYTPYKIETPKDGTSPDWSLFGDETLFGDYPQCPSVCYLSCPYISLHAIFWS